MNSGKTTSITVHEGNEGERIDVFLSKYFKRVSRSQIKKFIEDERITMDGEPVTASKRVTKGACICVKDFRDMPFKAEPEPVEFGAVYYDEDIIVVNKPSGLVVHPARKNLAGTLVNGILYRFGRLPESSVPGRPGIVHRLDRDTSGVMVVARTDEAFDNLKLQFKERRIHKEYVALTHGIPQLMSGVITKGIKPSETAYNRMTAAEDGKRSVTEYEVVRTCGSYAVLRLKPLTGRTHQIRLHCRSMGHPVLCDTLYGHEGTIRLSNITALREGQDNPAILSRLALHSEKLSLYHPRTGEQVSFSTPVPVEFALFLDEVARYEDQ